MNLREFGVRLSQFRERQKLSTTQLAGKLGVDYMTISRYEKGQNLPSLPMAIRLAQTLEVSLPQLVGTAEPPPPAAFRNDQLFQRMRDLDRLPLERQEMALRVIDTVIAGYELEDLSNRLKRG